MSESDRIESRLKQVLILDKMKKQMEGLEIFRKNIEDFLQNYASIKGAPMVDIFVDKNGQYKIKIEATASSLML